MTENFFDTPQFFLTSQSPCPYLENKQERKVFTHLVGKKAHTLNAALTLNGFRRSQNIAYRPACKNCQACSSVRIIVPEFEMSRNQKRVFRKNSDIVSKVIDPVPTTEQYSLFKTYLESRHATGSMIDMTAIDYAMMVEDSHVDTRLIEYRLPLYDDDITNAHHNEEITGEHAGKLVGVALTDYLNDGLSMVYSFFDPDLADRSFGTYMILDHWQKTHKLSLPYLYLGYWVRGSKKMDYKIRFQPQEQMIRDKWQRYKDEHQT